MQNLCRCRCCRVVDLKPSNDQKDGQTCTCNFEQRFRYRHVLDLKLPINLKRLFRPGHLSQGFFKSEIPFEGGACALLETTFCQSL